MRTLLQTGNSVGEDYLCFTWLPSIVTVFRAFQENFRAGSRCSKAPSCVTRTNDPFLLRDRRGTSVELQDFYRWRGSMYAYMQTTSSCTRGHLDASRIGEHVSTSLRNNIIALAPSTPQRTCIINRGDTEYSALRSLTRIFGLNQEQQQETHLLRPPSFNSSHLCF